MILPVEILGQKLVQKITYSYHISAQNRKNRNRLPRLDEKGLLKAQRQLWGLIEKLMFPCWLLPSIW